MNRSTTHIGILLPMDHLGLRENFCEHKYLQTNDESLSDGKICTLDRVDQLCAWLDATRKLDSRD